MNVKLKDITIKNVWAYIQGNIRYKLYYSKYEWVRNLLPKHIREQIGYRINSMDKQCFINGNCKLCGCQTTHLQCANKACDRPCYPYMLGKEVWKEILSGSPVYDHHTNLLWKIESGKFKIIRP